MYADGLKRVYYFKEESRFNSDDQINYAINNIVLFLLLLDNKIEIEFKSMCLRLFCTLSLYFSPAF